MEAMKECHQLIESLLQQAREQRATLKPIGDAFAYEAQRLFRHDQVVCLRRLKARLLHEASNIREEETIASNALIKVTLLKGVAEFALGGLLVTLAHSRKAFSPGAHLVQSDLSRTRPFGKVLVTVGHGGLPNDVQVIPLSRLARETNSSESGVKAALKARDYLLMTPDAFSNLVDELEGRVLHGSLTLPIASKRLRAEWHPTDIISQ